MVRACWPCALGGLLLAALSGCQVRSGPEAVTVAVRPKLALPGVQTDADDCAIWIHPQDPTQSVIIGNDKAGEKSGLYVYSLEGKVLQFIPLPVPNNLDVRPGLKLGDATVDICAVAVEGLERIKVFAIDPATRTLRDVTVPGGILSYVYDQTYGLALYRRPSDGTLYAFVSRRDRGYDIRQIRLEDDGEGRVRGTLVRSLEGSGIQYHVEGMVADDELGFLYACDEERAVLKYHAEPDKPSAPITVFATADGIKGDREGVAIYKTSPTTGVLVLSSQGNSTVKLYDRAGDNPLLATVFTHGADRTDGLDVTPCPVPSRFPEGFLVCHNNEGRNFVVYDWAQIASAGLP